MLFARAPVYSYLKFRCKNSSFPNKCYTEGDAEDVFISNLEGEITRVFSIKNVNSLEVIENSTKRDLSFTCVGGFISS